MSLHSICKTLYIKSYSTCWVVVKIRPIKGHVHLLLRYRCQCQQHLGRGNSQQLWSFYNNAGRLAATCPKQPIVWWKPRLCSIGAERWVIPPQHHTTHHLSHSGYWAFLFLINWNILPISFYQYIQPLLSSRPFIGRDSPSKLDSACRELQ